MFKIGEEMVEVRNVDQLYKSLRKKAAENPALKLAVWPYP